MTLNLLCKQHWKKIGIKNEKTLREYIEKIFEKHCEKQSQQDQVLVDIYKMVLPEWDNIKLVHGHPKAGSDLWKFICRCFQDFDQEFHPHVMHGGIWLNTGFSACSDIGPWEISFDGCTVEYIN
ncbi:MAG: hypothetical protein ABIK15_06035 [Pseudomonadota bacterium]